MSAACRRFSAGVANIHFAIEGRLQPNADYDKVTMVGHSMGGAISMYFARRISRGPRSCDARQSARRS
jgi:pimeloyl-ACP methyl ester carboxylesterase